MQLEHETSAGYIKFEYTFKVVSPTCFRWTDYDGENERVAMVTWTRQGIMTTVVSSQVDPMGPEIETATFQNLEEAYTHIYNWATHRLHPDAYTSWIWKAMCKAAPKKLGTDHDYKVA